MSYAALKCGPPPEVELRLRVTLVRGTLQSVLCLTHADSDSVVLEPSPPLPSHPLLSPLIPSSPLPSPPLPLPSSSPPLSFPSLPPSQSSVGNFGFVCMLQSGERDGELLSPLNVCVAHTGELH